MPAPPAHVLAAFGVSPPLEPLSGGQATACRAGDVVLKATRHVDRSVAVSGGGARRRRAGWLPRRCSAARPGRRAGRGWLDGVADAGGYPRPTVGGDRRGRGALPSRWQALNGRPRCSMPVPTAGRERIGSRGETSRRATSGGACPRWRTSSPPGPRSAPRASSFTATERQRPLRRRPTARGHRSVAVLAASGVRVRDRRGRRGSLARRGPEVAVGRGRCAAAREGAAVPIARHAGSGGRGGWLSPRHRVRRQPALRRRTAHRAARAARERAGSPCSAI
jgi:hypothetical protein